MSSYLLRRTGISVIVILGITALTFLLIHAIAPSPAKIILGVKASPAAIKSFNHLHGYDRPIWSQFITYLGNLLHGNLGYSYRLNQSVNSLIGENAGRSMYLTVVSTVLAVVIAIPLGIFQAVKRNSIADQAVTAINFTAYSMPQNFLGLILIGVFALKLGWFPSEAPQSESLLTDIADLRAMILPIVTLTVTSIAMFSRYMRSSALDALAQDYIRLARAKGLSERVILRRHLLRNASLSVITLLGLSLPWLMAGNLVVEYLFNFHGLGLLFVNELNNEDFDTVIGLVLIGGVLTVIGNFVADIALTMADPRVRLS